MLLALKLALVPAFLAALTVARRVWGPSVAGWRAGLPVAVQGATKRMLGAKRPVQTLTRELAEQQSAG